MKIMESLRTIFFGRHQSPLRHTAAKVDAALQAADDVADQSRVVNDKLRGYLSKPDPFMSLLIDISNERAARAQIAQWDQ